MSTSSPLLHDSYLQSLGRVQSVEFLTLNEKLEVVPYFVVTGDALVEVLVINEHTLRLAVDRVAAEVMHWGRVSALQKRCWQVRQRELRTWEAQKALAFRQSAEADKVKVTKDQVEDHYRLDPAYPVMYARVEAAEEAYNTAEAICRAYKTKADMLENDVWRAGDGSLQRRSV